MKWLLLMLVLAQVGGIACSRAQQAQSRVQRRPLEKQPHDYSSPVDYEWRERGHDPRTKRPVTYDHKPRVELVDAKTGKYAFKWIGHDGKERSVIIQRADAVDVVVSASVSKMPGGQYLYTYKVENLPSSGARLSRFTVQNFAPDTRPVEVNGIRTNNQDLRVLDAFRNALPDGTTRNLENVSIGQMSNLIQQFREGSWIKVALLSDFSPQVTPGRSLEVKMQSLAPPGIVGCRVYGGETEVLGADEHMPFVLENRLPGYEEYPKGYTIGPVDTLKSLTKAERIKHLSDRLPQFRQLGWVTDEAFSDYERRLKGGDLDSIFKRIEQDLKSEQITTEVFAIIEAMK